MDPKKNNPHNDPGTYQTGRTQPPKHYRGVVAVLLVLVILLSGISTALSILNFKLYFQLNQQATPQVAFSRIDNSQESIDHSEDLDLPGLGISGTVIPRVYQRYYKLPEGFYITQVHSGGQASQNGLLAGDIITAINGSPITDEDSVALLIQDFDPGQELQLQLYRSGSTIWASLIWND